MENIMTVEVAQSRRSKRVTTAVVAAVLRSLVEIAAAIKAFFRASNPASVGRRSESAAVETEGVTTSQIPADAEVKMDAGIRPIAHNELSEQEIERRRSLVRAFFNDFWSGTHDKPTAFVERLDQAEDYLNERLTANGEVWRLDAKTRIILGLPPRSS
jgi:hypothetical protein